VAVLEFGAIDFDHRSLVSQQTFRRRLHQPGLARAGRSQEQKTPHWPPGRVHAGQVRLIDAYDLFDCLILADHKPAQITF
jgi:hypothetical protein